MKIINEDTEYESRKAQYDTYLEKHIGGVRKAYQEILEPFLLTNTYLTVEELTKLRIQIENHDNSKYEDCEYSAYLDHWYPSSEHNDSQLDLNDDAYDYAWLHHQKNNSHHWQYWILVKDTPRDEDGGRHLPLPMDLPSICEMLCDWSSFQFMNDPTSTANAWYEEQRDNMILNEETRRIVEEILKELPEL